MRLSFVRATRRARSLLGAFHGVDAIGAEGWTSKIVPPAATPATARNAAFKPAVSLSVRDEIRRRAVAVADTWASDAARRD